MKMKKKKFNKRFKMNNKNFNNYNNWTILTKINYKSRQKIIVNK